MSETNIPERCAVEVGQVRRYGGKDLTVHAIEGGNVFYCQSGEHDPDGYRHDGGCCWFGLRWFSELPITSEGPARKCTDECDDCSVCADAPAIAPLAVDRTGCKALNPIDCGGCPEHAHPLAAQPAETLTLDAPCPGRCGGGAAADNGPCIRCKPAPQPAPAKLGCTNGRDCLSPTEPVFVRALRDERQPMCDRCYLDVEANLGKLMMFESSGTPYAGPTRLPRLKLAHVAGMHDDDLIGGRRG